QKLSLSLYIYININLVSLFIFHQVFTFNTVEINVQPSVKVKNGAPMSIICHADISKSADFQLKHNFTIFKDGKLVFMAVSDKDDARYEVPMARSSDTGEYECTVEAGGKTKSSNSLHVWVTGMTKPILTAEKKEVLEGEVVKLRCELPEEVPPLYFYFRKIKMNSTPKEKYVFEAYKNYSEVEFSVEEGDNILQFDCFGKRHVQREFDSSEHSNKTLVTVREPFIKPTLSVKPSRNITEGDRIQLECSTVVARMRDIEIILQKNKTILNSVRDEKVLKYSAVATLEDSGEYLCKVEQGRASKSTKVNVVVSELFPKPTLAASMNKLDENRELTLSCSISGFQRAKFSVLRRNSNGDVLLETSRNLTMRVSVNDTGSYICKAEVKGIVKESKPIRINVYGELIKMFRTQWCQISCHSLPFAGAGNVLQTFHSSPTLSVVSGLPEVVLGRPLQLICRSARGTPPITFKFYKGNVTKETVTNDTYATVIWRKGTMSRQDTGTYYCMASNRANVDVKSHPITISVILASWQKGVIVAFVLISIAGAVTLALWWFLCKKKKGNEWFPSICDK
uniref:Platelet endothelial cell adhesion molecule n=1 Tax=Amazona collaria TaxID=241587 RepID=A0A8B9FUW3_9PSIT